MSMRLRVLLVEDDPVDAELNQLELQRHGYEVISARVQTAAEMRAALQQGGWDLVLSDHAMPDFSAPEALALLQEYHLDVPFLIVSGVMGESHAVAAMKAGADDYIYKGNLARLAPAVERELAESASRQARRAVEAALLATEEKYRMMVDFTYDWEEWLSPDGTFLYVSPSCYRITGYRPQEFLNDPELKRNLILPEDRQHFCEHQERALSGEAWDGQIQFRIRTRHGQVLWISHLCRPVYRQDGAYLGQRGSNRDITAQKRLEQELLASHQQLRELAVYLQQAREEERIRIAREIHDEFGQVLTGLKLDMRWLTEHIPSDQPELARRTFRALSSLDTAFATVRRIATELRPALLDQLGLVAAIEWLVEEFRRKQGIPCHLSPLNEDLQVHPEQATDIFRILQEALTNIGRHAAAREVWVAFEAGPNNLTLTVSDNGVGLPPENERSSRSFGLLGMRERALHWGGSFQIASRLGGGTEMQVVLPTA